VNDAATVSFWNDNFGKEASVKINAFATAFVKRFQNGENGFPVYPSEVLYTIVDHFVARRSDLKEEEFITTKDILTYVSRFGSLKTSVDTICENFLDPKGDVHIWYHFDVTNELINRKLLTEKKSSFAVMDYGVKHSDDNPKNNTYSGDFSLRLHKITRGKKEETIEKIKDSSGKVTYGTRVVLDKQSNTPKQLDKPLPFEHGLLHYLGDRTKDYIPLQSSLWVGAHAIETKLSDGTTALSIEGVDKEDESLSKDLLENMWKPYNKENKPITKLTYPDWELRRGERNKVASNRYRHWQSGYKHYEDDSTDKSPKKQMPAFDATRYVQGSLLLNSPH